MKIKYIFDVCDWEDLKLLQKYQMEVDSYSNILTHLINSKIDVTSQSYQNYQQLYLDAYFNLFDYKGKFVSFLKTAYNIDNNNFKWDLNFHEKKVYIYE